MRAWCVCVGGGGGGGGLEGPSLMLATDIY